MLLPKSLLITKTWQTQLNNTTTAVNKWIITSQLWVNEPTGESFKGSCLVWTNLAQNKRAVYCLVYTFKCISCCQTDRRNIASTYLINIRPTGKTLNVQKSLQKQNRQIELQLTIIITEEQLLIIWVKITENSENVDCQYFLKIEMMSSNLLSHFFLSQFTLSQTTTHI